MKNTIVLFDIGGTKTRVTTSTDGEQLGSVESFATPKDPKKGIAQIISVAESLSEGLKIASFVGGIRGVLNEENTGIEHDEILANWVNFDVVAAIQKIHDVPVTLENDAALAGLGEAMYGAGQGIDILVYHTISTGVGGVRIHNGMIDESSAGFEPGHQVLDIDRTILGEDVVPTLENLVSGAAVEARLGVKPYEIPQEDVIWNELAGYLAQGLRNTVLYWSPEAIVLGGSMMIGDPKIPLDAVRKATVAVLDSLVPCPFITTAQLGDEAGLYGALALYASSKN